MLSNPQLAILKTDINSKLNTVITGGTIAINLGNSNFQNIADYYNSNSANTVWRPDVKASEVTAQVVGSVYVLLTAVKQNGFQMYLLGGTIDATAQTVRDGFSAIFGNGATLTNLTNVSKRTATIFEMLFVGAAQSGSYVSSLYGYQVTANDIQEAIR